MVSDSVWSNNNSDWVISFPITSNKNSIFKDQLYGVKLLEYVKLTQQNWIEEGTNIDLCINPLIRHNVSNTIQVDNWEEVEDYIFENRKYFAGISLLSISGDKDYNQAPFTTILTPKELVKKYGDAAVFASGLIVDGLNAFNDNLWLACDTVLGIGEKLEYSEKEVEEKIKFSTPKELWEKLGFKNGTLDTLAELYIKPEVEEYKRYMDTKLNGTVHNHALKKDWVRRAKQFADRHFTSIKEMAYCLKDVHNYHKWIEIKRELEDVDWKNVNIKPKYTDIDTIGAIACAGGSCEI
jgi:ribonucleoside-diphosphate reductase alpha chain